jgi:hypothetical protein
MRGLTVRRQRQPAIFAAMIQQAIPVWRTRLRAKVPAASRTAAIGDSSRQRYSRGQPKYCKRHQHHVRLRDCNYDPAGRNERDQPKQRILLRAPNSQQLDALRGCRRQPSGIDSPGRHRHYSVSSAAGDDDSVGVGSGVSVGEAVAVGIDEGITIGVDEKVAVGVDDGLAVEAGTGVDVASGVAGVAFKAGAGTGGNIEFCGTVAAAPGEGVGVGNEAENAGALSAGVGGAAVAGPFCDPAPGDGSTDDCEEFSLDDDSSSAESGNWKGAGP